MRPLAFTLFLSALGILGFSTRAHGIIVGGTLGTGTNNDTEAGLQSHLSTTSNDSFNYWSNLVRVNDASGVYLGYNESTGNGWVLGAAHVGNPGTITVAGITYAVANTQSVTGTDLLLLEISGVANTAAAVLPSVNLASTTATVNEFVLMTGRGFTTSTSSPYSFGTTGILDSQAMRWGTNRVSAVALVNVDGSVSTHIVTDFDSPSATTGPGAVTPYEGQVSGGDSGGGMFAYRSGQWVLIGVGHYVNSASGNSAAYGDGSGYTDVFTYRTGINTITGVLIPEPSSVALLPLAAGLTLLRRRRK